MTESGEPRETWWQVFIHAVRGTGGDPTSGPLKRAVILLAIPMVLEMVMESLFAVVDIFFVSKLGDEAMAAVALTESGITIIYTLAVGLSIGVTALVARRIGEGNRDGAARAAAQALFLGVLLAVVFGVTGVVFAADILRLMGADETVVATGLPYTQTTIGRGTAVLVQLYTLLRLGGMLRIRRPHLRVQPAIMARLVRLSATGTLQTFIGTASWIGLIRVTAEFGAEALAGYVIAIRVILFAILPAWGLSNAAATMVGQGLGAGDPERAERAVWISCRMNLVFLGAVWTPTIINLFCFWLCEIPLAWVLAFPVGMGPNGVFIAMTVSFSALAVVSAVLFKRGRWKRVRV